MEAPPPRERTVRPTLRCLLNDLMPNLGPDKMREACRTIEADLTQDPDFVLSSPMSMLEHPVLEKADGMLQDIAAQTPIKSFADEHVLRVKTGPERGALWLDEETGVWWLLAAGRRKDDGPGDFYRELPGNAADLLPTKLDKAYLTRESKFAQECSIERAAHEQVIRTLLQAARSLGVVQSTTIFGATLSIRIDHDEDDVDVLDLSWHLVSYEDQDRFPADVLAMIPGRDQLDHWDFLPPPAHDPGGPGSWYTYVPTDWVMHLATSVEIDDLLGNVENWSPQNPSTDGSEMFSHHAAGHVVTLAYITGIPIDALCGAVIVAHRDPEKLPVCPACEDNLVLLRSMRSTGAAD